MIGKIEVLGKLKTHFRSFSLLFISFLFYSVLSQFLTLSSLLLYFHLIYYRPLLHLVSSFLLASSPNLIWSHQYHHIQYRIVKYGKVQSNIVRYDKIPCNTQGCTTEHSKFSIKKDSKCEHRRYKIRTNKKCSQKRVYHVPSIKGSRSRWTPSDDASALLQSLFETNLSISSIKTMPLS